jgi:predicted helicase
MRESLLNSFDGISVVNLHGEGSNASDENVFGVRSGVAVVLAVKCNIHKSGSTGPAKRMQCASLRGSRANKFATLEIQSLPSIAREIVRTGPPHWRLAEDTDRTGLYSSAADEYASYWPVDRIFRHYTSGVQTKNDAMFVGFTPDQVAQQVRARLKRLRDAPPFDAALIQPYMLAPFDRRWVYYDSRVIGRARLAVMRHMLRPNLGLVFMRQSTNAGEYDHFLAVDCLVSDRVFYSRHGAPFLAPLWLADEGSGFGVQGSGRQSNLAVDFCDHITEAVGEPLDPLEVFHYLYAMAYSPRYRARYAAQLKRGFPRFGLPVSREQYQRLGALGRQLVELHVAGLGRSTPGAGLLPVKDGIDATGDEFRIGGYDVLKRWARPRRASGLSADDERQLDRLAWIGRETRRLTEEIEAKHEV